MELLNSLYSVISARIIDDGYLYDVRLDPEHFIYKAHFPGEPITPGVCIMQMALELLSLATGKELNLECVKNVKFLHIVNPSVMPEIRCNVRKLVQDGSQIKAQAEFSFQDEPLAKLSIICQIIGE